NYPIDYSTAFLILIAVDDYLSAGSATSINASKSNLRKSCGTVKEHNLPPFDFWKQRSTV
ncbi:MAG: hypothetical protein IKA41_00010, partial [Bacteroidaceae bacterium]|nr:hypothetical protein [Bacteroidaceae bacterium]